MWKREEQSGERRMTQGSDMVSGSCHCGGVRFAARLTSGLDKPVRCNCSMCRMRGAVIVFAAVGGLEITEGAELLTEYKFHTGVAKHYFCSRCGIYTHHQRRFDPTQYAINVACLDGVSPFDFAEVPVVDGHNHPGDTGGGALKVIAVQRLERT
jgi:hypothetical protein